MILKPYVLLAGLSLGTLIARSQSITDAQALDAGHAIEKAENNGDVYPLDHFLEPDSLLDKIRQKSQFLKDPATLAGFRSTFIPSITNAGFGRQILATTHNGNYRLLREFDKDGIKHLLFRMFGDGGLNYHDYKLVRVGDSIRASDLYTYSLDEWTSSQMAGLVDMMGQSSNMTGDVGIMQKMRQDLNKQEYAAVRQDYEQLDKKYRNSKAVQLMYIHACEHIDLGLYQKALEDYSATFPDATSSYLMLLDLYYIQKEYAKDIDAVGKLDKLVGGDPFLDYYRGNIYTLMNKPAEALACYEKVYRYDPTLKANVLKLIARYAAGGQQEKAKKIIDAYMQTPAYHTGDLNTVYDQYPDLR